MTRLLKWLKGYVVIRLDGYAPERFLNLCSHHHIILWGMISVGTGYEMCISVGGFRRLRPLVRKTRTKVVILERHGLPFMLYRYRNRKLFAVGAAAGIILLYLMSLFIWNIHVEGNYSLSDQVVLDYLESVGVVHGMKKRDVHGERIEELLREYFPEITWTSVEVKGTRLIVHVQENEDAAYDTVPEDEPADLAAADSGTIVSMIVRSGTPLVSEGMEVQEGDLLVSGRIEVLDDAGEVARTQFVHADADILIRKTEYYEESFSMNYEKKVYTGKERTSFYLILGSKRIHAGRTGDAFARSDTLTAEYPLKITENYYLPIVFGKNTEKEYVLEPSVSSREEAEEKAKEELNLFFKKMMNKGLQIIENDVKIEVNGDLCTAAGTWTLEKEGAREQAPDMTDPVQDETVEEREQT